MIAVSFNTKALKNRIKSVDSTLHLTKAMGLVASSKIRRANDGMAKAVEYYNAVKGILKTLTDSPECAKSPYMRPVPTENARTRLIVIAGDRGLAGGYNANIFRAVRDMPQAEGAQIIPIGKRASERYGGEFISSEHFFGVDAFRLAEKLCADFAAGEFDRLGIVCTEYVSMMTQTPDIRWILPLEKTRSEAAVTPIFEPDESRILEIAVKQYVSGAVAAAVKESFACEVAARRMAMDSAGKNAKQMIDDLQLQYNRARQGAITQEITEIVAGSGS